MGAEQATAFMNPGEANIALSNCRIVIVGPRSGDDYLMELAHLPKEARILATGNTVEELRQDGELFTEVGDIKTSNIALIPLFIIFFMSRMNQSMSNSTFRRMLF
jgi:hypothetical protein